MVVDADGPIREMQVPVSKQQATKVTCMEDLLAISNRLFNGIQELDWPPDVRLPN
jgi:hypothetical protein